MLKVAYILRKMHTSRVNNSVIFRDNNDEIFEVLFLYELEILKSASVYLLIIF